MGDVKVCGRIKDAKACGRINDVTGKWSNGGDTIEKIILFF